MGKLYDAAKTGDSTKLLTALRDDIARKLDEGMPGRDYAATVKSLINVVDRLDAIKADKDEKTRAKRKRNRLADASEKFKVVA